MINNNIGIEYSKSMSSSLSRRKMYRSRSKRSLCRKPKTERKCNRVAGCKYAKGTKRRFCRKARNTRRA